MRFQLTEAADHDIERILQDTLELFGPHQLQAYSDLIDQALQRVGTDPQGLGTSKREDIGPGVRALPTASILKFRSLPEVRAQRILAGIDIHPVEGAGKAQFFVCFRFFQQE